MAAEKKQKPWEADLISDLPEPILIHILSLIPTKYSVRTKVLSKRWSRLSSLVPTLHFSIHSDLLTSRFFAFVAHVFNSYDALKMDRFCYHVSSSADSIPDPRHARVFRWIQEAVRRNVREIHVSVDFHLIQALPLSVYTSNTLTVLKLKANFLLQVPDEVRLLQLRTLHLLDVTFTESGPAQRLFQNCPMLEDLYLHCSFDKDFQVVDISLPCLRTLTICRYVNDYSLVLDAPNLENLELFGAVEYGSLAVQDLKSLSRAHFSFYAYEGLEKIFAAICHVRRLCLDAMTLDKASAFFLPFQFNCFMAFKSSGWSLPMFCNLAHLEIKVYSSYDSGYVLNLLDKTPCLEVLVIDNRWSPIGDSRIDEYLLPKDVPTCVSLHLKEVEFIGFTSLDFECKLVEYFLKNAKVLDLLKIQSKYILETEPKMRKNLLALSSCSSSCQIKVSNMK